MLERIKQVWLAHVFLKNMFFKTCLKAVVSFVSDSGPWESSTGLLKGNSWLLTAAGTPEHPPGRLMSPLNLGAEMETQKQSDSED